MAHRRLRVTVAGKTFEVLVDVLDEDNAAEEAAGQRVPAAGTAQSSAARLSQPAVPSAHVAPVVTEGASEETGIIGSPMAGTMMAVQVGLGDTVHYDTPVATVEAMKMENIVYAGCAGKVMEVFVKAGDPVNEGQAILRVL